MLYMCATKDKVAAAIVQTSHELVQSCDPNARLVSLGQSPAWFVKCIQHTYPNKTTILLPFSSHFTKKAPENSQNNENNTSKFTLNSNSEMEDAVKHQENFAKHLEKHNLLPNQIITEGKNGKPTIVIDGVSSGTSLASFISIITALAQSQGCYEEMMQYLQFKVYVLATTTLCKIMSIQVECFFGVNTFTVDVPLHFVKLSDIGIVNGLATTDVGRLVPSFPPAQWGVENCYTTFTTDNTVRTLQDHISLLLHPEAATAQENDDSTTPVLAAAVDNSTTGSPSAKC